MEWAVSQGEVPYEQAGALMEARAAEIADGTAAELIWLLEHPPLYTAGTSADLADVLEAHGLPVLITNRGGQVTYHGPGQRMIYVMANVQQRFQGDVRLFVETLESTLIAALASFGVAGETRDGMPGVWVRTPNTDGAIISAKIAALGLRVRRGVSFHGMALNVDPDLSRFDGIVPCGLPGSQTTSLAALGGNAGGAEIDRALKAAFAVSFGVALTEARPPK